MTSIKWYAWTFSLFLLGIIVIADMGLAPVLFPFIRDVPYVDKLGHFFLMGGLSLFFNLSLSGRQLTFGPMSLQCGTLIVLLLVTAEEFSQLYFDHRKFDLMDLFWSVAGALAFGFVAAILLERRRVPGHDAVVS